jgi:hypothetical protein
MGHYGAIKGLNNMADMDCLATLGDPWPNVGQVSHDMAYLEMLGGSDERIEALCRAELEQAHGRLRTVHRKRPGRALHIGKVLPEGSGWYGPDIKFCRMKEGRPGPMAPMSVEELERIIDECGGLRAAAERAGCSRRYLQICRKGERPISEKIAAALRNIKSDL